jgi:RimJ/RimL family protein N-acetyltransferase
VTGKHVKLERLGEAHFVDLYEAIGRPGLEDIWKHWPEGPFTNTEFDEYMNMFLKMRPGDLATYVVIPLSGPYKDKALGIGFALSEDRLTNRIGETGAFFGPNLQKTRAGTEAIYLLLDLLFGLNHRRVGWKTSSLNVRSQNAAMRYGFVYEGTLRQVEIEGGRNRDTVWFSIIDSEWPLRKRAFERWLEDGNFDDQERQKSRIQDIRKSLT